MISSAHLLRWGSLPVNKSSQHQSGSARACANRVVDRTILHALSSTSTDPDTRQDERSAKELINVALCEHDDHLRWDAICALQRRGSDEVFQRAAALCGSFCEFERELGADILGQLDISEEPLLQNRVALLLEMLETERAPRVLIAVLSALGHQRSVEAIEPASRLRHHDDNDVRFAVVMALMYQDHPVAVASLIELTRDRNSDVRDWATFALGTQSEMDSREIREALAARLSDEDDDTRCEALVGLARRGDDRVVAPLIKALGAETVSSLELEAAELIADPRLYPALLALRGRWQSHDEELENAIRTCAPPQ